MCIVDSGLDLRHPDFRRPDGGTRVRWLIDLEGSPRTGEGRALEEELGGSVWSQAEIDAVLLGITPGTLPRDEHGHGTAVASAAVGDDAGEGEEAPGPLAGVAPAADLIVVDALREGGQGFEDPDLVRGLRFCLAVAERPERTAVVFALGGHDGPHDGSSPLARELAALAGERGALLVAAAGNDGGAAVHARLRIPEGSEAAIEVRVPEASAEAVERRVALSVQLSFEGGAIMLTDPVSEEGGVHTPWVSAGGSASVEGALGRLSLAAAEDDPSRLYARIEDGEAPEGRLRAGTRRLLVRGPARLEAWLVESHLPGAFFGAALAGAYVVSEGSVTIPAAHPAIFAVGASLSRDRVSLEGGSLELAGELGEPAAFSSAGPNAAGFPKPDLIAPGGLLLLALSGDLRADDPDNLFGGVATDLARRRLEDRVALAGSSFAAAIAAGAIALGLSLDPSLEAPEVAALLRITARRPAGAPEGAWDPSAGAGVLDLGELLRALRAPRPGPAEPALSGFSLTRERVRPGLPSGLYAFARLRDRSGLPAEGTLELWAPGWRLSLPVAGGEGVAPLAIPDLRAGQELWVRASLDGEPLAPRPLRVEAGEGPYAALSARGGCSLSPRAPPLAGGRWRSLRRFGLVGLSGLLALFGRFGLRRRLSRPRARRRA